MGGVGYNGSRRDRRAKLGGYREDRPHSCERAMCKLGAREQALVVLVFFNLMVVIFVVLPADCTGWAVVHGMSSAWAWESGLASKQASKQASTQASKQVNKHTSDQAIKQPSNQTTRARVAGQRLQQNARPCRRRRCNTLRDGSNTPMLKTCDTLSMRTQTM